MQKQDFECSITAADRYRLGEPITVKFEIRNTSRETYRILTWGTPLGGDPLDFLTVTQDDVELEYDGPLVYHGDPAKDDWITLEPGASRSAEVDISRLYPIDLPGEYTATLTTTLADAYPVKNKADRNLRSRGDYQSHPLDETKVMFVVEAGVAPRMTAGQAARHAELERAGDLAIRREYIFNPILRGGTKKQRADTLTAHTGMVALAAKAYNLLTNNNIGANVDYREWFGKDGKFFPWGPNRSAWVRGTFDHLRQLPNAAFPIVPTYDLTANKPGSNAYTYSNSWTIYLCKGFRDAKVGGYPSSKRSILTHEWTHARGGTSDYGTYGDAAARALAISDPQKAVTCAENYEYFSESI